MSSSLSFVNCNPFLLHHHPTPFTAAVAMCSTFCPRLRILHSGSYFNKSRRFSPHFSSVSASAQTQGQVIETPTRIGFLGLGIMGSPMAQNLIKAGVDLTVWNRTKSKCDPLISLGAKYKSSPEEVAASCDVTFAMLADPQSAVDVACGKHGAVNGMGPGKGMMASFSEGLLLSEKVGLDPNVLVEVISQGAINAPMYSMKGPSMIKSVYPTAFPLKHQQKDLRLALGLAESVSQPTPIAAAANELYKVAKSHGFSDQDFSAVIEALKSKFQHSESQ